MCALVVLSKRSLADSDAVPIHLGSMEEWSPPGGKKNAHAVPRKLKPTR